MKSMLVGLDQTPGAEAAASLAIEFASAHRIPLTGVSVFDADYLAAPEPTGIGGAYYKERIDRMRQERARESIREMNEHFRSACAAKEVSCRVLESEGSPEESLIALGARHDLIVIGNDADFHGEAPEGTARVVAHILRQSSRPLIVSPRVSRMPRRIAIAYDGSVPAARTLQLFVLLGMASGTPLDMISIHADRSKAEQAAAGGMAYLGLYGLSCTCRPIITREDPAEVVIRETAAAGADLLVMGAYGHRGWREALLGSFTSKLLGRCPIPLFIHH